jgi:prepilin-type processing-associated H-X9-DG protein
VAGAGVGLGIMMPALVRVQQQAKKTHSMANLKNLGLAMHMYEIDRGMLPDRLEKLKDEYVQSGMLESPSKPKDFDGPSYIYVAGQNMSMDPDNVLIYENPTFCPDGVNVLFIDGSVKWMEPDAFRQRLEATYKQLDREMPEIEFKNP